MSAKDGTRGGAGGGRALSPPVDLVDGEALLWKMADVKGLFRKRVVTGYLITNYRCFVWDAEMNKVRASVPVANCEVVVSFIRKGARTRRGGTFLLPPPLGEGEQGGGEDQLTTIGDVSFRVDDKTVMVFREVSDPERIKWLVEALRTRGERSRDERVNIVVRPGR